MTYQDAAIPAEAMLTGDAMAIDGDGRMPQPACQSTPSRGTLRTDRRGRMPLVLVVEDGEAMAGPMRELCDFLNIAVDRIDSDEDLLPFLRRCQPMAVVAAMDAAGQDGGNVLMTVARHDPSLPVLLITDGDPVLAGAADAMTELCGLTEVVQADAWPAPGNIAEFLCRAGLRGHCLALLPV